MIRTVRLLNLLHRPAIMLLWLQTRTRSGPNRSMWKNADHDQTRLVAAILVSTEEGPTRDVVEVARALWVVAAAKVEVSPRKLAGATFSNVVERRATLRRRDVARLNLSDLAEGDGAIVVSFTYR